MNKFFIIGCPRSGTTMVQQALNRHPHVAIPPETKFFFSFFGQSRRRQLRHLERLDRDLQITLPRPAGRIGAAAEGRAFYETMAQRYVERFPEKDVVSFGEKTPEHTGHLPQIRQLFPEAKIIVLYRDGRDVALSLTKVPWMSSDLYVNFLVWLYYQRVLRDVFANPCPNIYCARYEDIVAEPEKELRGMLRFLDLPYDKAVAEGFGNKEGIPEREYAWKERALEKITPDRVGTFRRELDPGEIDLMERLGRHALPSLGYRLLTDGRCPLSARFLLRLAFNTSKLLCRLPWPSVTREVLNRACFGQPEIPAAPLAVRPALT